MKGYGKIDKVPIPVSETGKGCTNKLDMHQAPKKKIYYYSTARTRLRHDLIWVRIYKNK